MEGVKRQNRSLILNYIKKYGPVSRKEIADATGLTAASVTQISTHLLNDGLIKENRDTEKRSVGVGRKKVPLDIVPEAAFGFSINIEIDETTVALCDLSGEIVTKKGLEQGFIKTLPTDKSIPPEDFLKRITDICSEFKNDLPGKMKSKVVCASVGITGNVDAEEGTSLHAYGIWDRTVDIRNIIGSELGIPVLLENNVDAFAAAVLLYGSGRTNENVLVLKWGPGVGSTIIINGQIYRGSNGKTSEIGHCIVDMNGEKCSCGRTGCLETLLSYQALNKIIDFQPDDFENAYINASPEDKAKIDERILYFAMSIVNSNTMIAPSRIVLCGELFAAESVRNRLLELCRYLDANCDDSRIIYTTLHDKESYIGPAAVFLKSILG